LGRFLRRTIVLITLGLVTTFAVSACSSVFVRATLRDQAEVDAGAIDGWRIQQCQKPSVVACVGVWLGASISASRGAGSLVEPKLIDWAFADAPVGGARGHSRAVFAHGWPFPAFAYLADRTALHTPRQMSGAISWGAMATGDILLLRPGDPHAIGIIPLWRGVVLDSAIHALCWMVLLIGARRLRARIRVLTVRRIVLLAIVALLLGAATSALVAMICGRMIGIDHAGTQHVGEYSTEAPGRTRFLAQLTGRGAMRWTAHFNPDPKNINLRFYKLNATAGTLAPRWTDVLVPHDDTTAVWIVDARGWPFICFWGAARVGWEDGSLVTQETRHVLLWERGGSVYGNELAWMIVLGPIWSGLALNTAIYAFAWFALFLLVIGPERLRRAHRLARGLCPRCCYPFGGAERCPECGTEVAAVAAKIASGALGTRAW